MPSKLLVLGLDAADPFLLRRWASDGTLPSIRALMDQGTSGAVRGLEGFFIGSTWPSLYTGLNPAEHGFYRIEQLQSGSYGFFRPLETTTGVAGAPFWKLASDQGRRIAVLDVPLTRLDPTLNGLQIVEWGGHDSVFGFHATPPGLVNEVLSLVGEYPLPSNCDARRTTAVDFEQFVGALERAVEKKTSLTLELLDRDDWDLFVQVFTEAHCAGHQCWHLHDPTHPAHEPEAHAAVGDPLERVYRALDRAVGVIVERARASHVLLISAHGMSAYRGADFLLPEILYRLGVTAQPAVSAPAPQDLGDHFKAVARATWRRLPGVARNALHPVRAVFANSRAAGPTNVSEWADVSASQCFPVPNGSPVSGIRLNLAGREPQGLLQPGVEADAFCDELERNLLAIVDERTGLPLITDVARTDVLYSGPRRDALPDLLAKWNDTVATGTLAHAGGRGAAVRARSTKIGVAEGSNAYVRTGEHVPEGLFVCVGPDIPIAEKQEPVQLIDFHPTVCSVLGLATPAVNGEVIPELSGTPTWTRPQ